MRLLIIFTFITAQFLLSVQASEEMPDLYCGDKNCYEGKVFIFMSLLLFISVSIKKEHVRVSKVFWNFAIS